MSASGLLGNRVEAKRAGMMTVKVAEDSFAGEVSKFAIVARFAKDGCILGSKNGCHWGTVGVRGAKIETEIKKSVIVQFLRL